MTRKARPIDAFCCWPAGTFGVFTPPDARAQSFDWLSVAGSGSDKCDSSAAIIVLSRRINARCISPSGECTDEIRVPLEVQNAGCKPRGTVAFENAAAYITGWYQWSVNWEQSPEEWVEQIHHVSYALFDQRVERSATGTELVAQLKYRFNAAGAPEYFSPEYRDLVIGIEVVAVDPTYGVFVSIERYAQSVSGVGSSVGGLRPLPTSSGWTLAYLGLASFTLQADQGVTPGGSPQGVNLTRFEFFASPVLTQGGAEAALSCRLEGNRIGPQVTTCSADYVAVFADANIAFRPPVQTECSITGAAVKTTPQASVLNYTPLNGSSPCALTGFSFETESNFSSIFNGLFMKSSALGAGTFDCENAFGPSAVVHAVLNGREVLDPPSLSANQEPRAWCHGTYVCPSPSALSWGGYYFLDSAVLR